MASKEDILSKVTESFQRLCGGGIKTGHISGCKCYSSLKQQVYQSRSEDNRNQWLSHLEELAEKSLSFPNGPLPLRVDDRRETIATRNKRRKVVADDTVNIGKPHDVEIKLALSFFHRYKHRCIKDQSPPSSSTNNGNNIKAPLEIISDTGLTRAIESPIEFAKLMVNQLEDIIWHERQRQNQEHDKQSQRVYSIRVDQTGIICLVTPQRVEYLRGIGRLSCSLCTKWVKGEKGLWWHCQKEHGLDHSIATSISSSSTGINDLSIVVYYNEKTSEEGDKGTTILDLRSSNPCVRNEMKIESYFQIIKDGNLHKLLAFLKENQDCNVITHSDRNGATALHWAAGCGHLDIVKFLIQAKHCPPDQGQKGKRSFRNRTPLHWASRNGHLVNVKYLVEECNVDINAVTFDGTTAFCWACWQGHESIMR
jgi:hypothetical protein